MKKSIVVVGSYCIFISLEAGYIFFHSIYLPPQQTILMTQKDRSYTFNYKLNFQDGLKSRLCFNTSTTARF